MLDKTYSKEQLIGHKTVNLLISKFPKDKQNKIKVALDLLEPEAEELYNMSIGHIDTVTTKDGYGYWYKRLGQFPANDRELIALAVVRAGANYFGVSEAIKLLKSV
jgi:hypothetical protein